ncbi:MAG: VOC family protein [Candidatus Neomarinimicrobiota bacterium]
MKNLLNPIHYFIISVILFQSFLIGEENEKIKFSRDIIDIAIVVEDLEETAKFYREILGLTELNRWDAPKEPLTTLGFTDNLPFQMVTFNTGKSSKTSSILKFISFKEIESESPSKDFIHSSIGLGFITIKVENMDEQLRRLKKANIEFLGETPTRLWNEYFAVFRDPSGNMVELVAPYKEKE